MKNSKNFLIQELVPEIIWKRYGENSRWFISKEMVEIIQKIRNRYGKSITVNNWYFDGRLQYRGYRPPMTEIGSMYSQHKLGQALDFNVEDYEPGEVYADIITHQDLFLGIGVTTIEDLEYTPTWTHIDRRNTKLGRLLIIKP